MTRRVDLTFSRWQFVDVAGEALADVPERSRPSLTFESDGQVYGSGGVNRLRGTYRLDGDHLTFGPVVSTRMAGTPEHTRREEAVLALLSGGVRVRVEDPAEVGGDGGAAGQDGARLDGVVGVDARTTGASAASVLVLADPGGRESRLVAVEHEPTRPEPPSEPEPGT
jgi:heat shock protein HslJ